MVPVPERALGKRTSPWWTWIAFLLVAAAGLYWAKWYPYWGKAWSVATKHSLGTSILTGGMAVPPAPSWQAAVQYALTYFKAIWPALLVGLVLGSLVQVWVPRTWLQRWLGQVGLRSTLLGGVLALPGMMCTCCSAPVVVGLRRQDCGANAAAAFWLGNTALNPAVLVFMVFVLPWRYAVLRLVFGVLLVLGAACWIGWMERRQAVVNGGEVAKLAPAVAHAGTAIPVLASHTEQTAAWPVVWVRKLASLATGLLPVYLLSVLVLGGVRSWLFPATAPGWGNSFLAIGVWALAGAVFVIPTAAEIPIVQALLAAGVGAGPAAALLISLPALSFPSTLMVRRAFTRQQLANGQQPHLDGAMGRCAR
ncbi:MAG: permease [Alicyclobacillus sp.]|nr:permease [Alicyclobacillus sp.]